MKALVLEAYKQLVYQEVAEPEIEPDEVLVRVKACGICGSDIHGLDGSTGRRIPPLIMGHEAAGEIVRVGNEVTRWKIGDRVTFDSTISCGRCYFCQRGEINLCDHRRVVGVSCEDYRQHGAFAEYLALPERILYRIPDDLPFEKAAFTEPVSIAVHAVKRTAITPADTVMVIGSGMIGLLVIQVLRAYGCGRIIAVDLDSSRLQMALQLGADEAWRSNQIDVAKAIQQQTEGRGADAALEVVGITPTVNLAVQCVRKGGRVTLVGNIAPKTELLLQQVVTRELTLYGSCGSQGEYPECLDLITAGKIQLDPLISAVAPLSDGARWFDQLYHGQSNLLKVILQP
jgi:L-iditol 2-dehydrogenase